MKSYSRLRSKSVTGWRPNRLRLWWSTHDQPFSSPACHTIHIPVSRYAILNAWCTGLTLDHNQRSATKTPLQLLLLVPCLATITMSMIDDGVASSSNNSWQPLQALDLTAIGFTTCVDVAMALLAFHVVLHRAWVPYKAVNPSLVACTGLAVSTTPYYTDSSSNCTAIALFCCGSGWLFAGYQCCTASWSRYAWCFNLN